jgi:geranylgeranylglycerol-phosphate geranylgeranyltransferase
MTTTITAPTLRQKTGAAFALSRPVNVLIGAASILLGAVVTGGSLHPAGKIVLACVSGALIMAGANAINDVYDLDIDRINRPHRPLPAAQLSPRTARGLAIFYFTLGVFFSIFLTPVSVVVATTATALLWLYSARLKRTVLWGNLTVSLVAGLAFIYGGLVAGRWAEALIPAGFAFLFHLGREVIKDIEDLAGDRELGAVTLPIRYGRRVALRVAVAAFALLLVATYMPFALGLYSSLYWKIVLLGVDTVLIYVIVVLLRDPSVERLGRLSGLLKADMMVGLAAVFFR